VAKGDATASLTSLKGREEPMPDDRGRNRCDSIAMAAVVLALRVGTPGREGK